MVIKDYSKMSQKEFSIRNKLNAVNDRKDPAPKKDSKKKK
tara:strand:- start:6572 stop:6691 length:120 start_codon:yes stop_codon:yes gene_type:complete